MILNSIARSLAIGMVAIALSSCAAVEAQRAEQQKQQETFEHRLDIAHIYVTPGDPPSNKPFNVLGEVSYSEPFTPETISEERIKAKLKSIAYAKWPDTLDALVKEKSDVSDDGTNGEGFGSGHSV